jgi:hypothetical protein
MRDTIELPEPLRRLIPPRIKRPVKAALLSYLWRQAVRDLAKLRPGEAPSRELLRKLRLGWDNQGFDAKLAYFEEIVKHAVGSHGPILECGSGLTTVVLGHLAGRRNVRTWSLEHDAEWYRRVSSAIDRHHVPGVKVCLAPLRDYGRFSWYDPGPENLPEKFSLVICDGPPDLANGGRYGLLPVLGDRLEPGAVILFDDAEEPGQPEVLRRWQAERGVSVDLRKTAEVCFAVVKCP